MPNRKTCPHFLIVAVRVKDWPPHEPQVDFLYTCFSTRSVRRVRPGKVPDVYNVSAGEMGRCCYVLYDYLPSRLNGLSSIDFPFFYLSS